MRTALIVFACIAGLMLYLGIGMGVSAKAELVRRHACPNEPTDPIARAFFVVWWPAFLVGVGTARVLVTDAEIALLPPSRCRAAP